MNAVRVNGFGGVENLELTAAPTPQAAEGEVVVRVRACALNFSDVLKRRGDYPGGPTPPFWAGVEAAGEIEGTGERVVFLAEGGAQSTYAAVPRAACTPFGERLSFEQAAAFGVSHLTAYHALVTQGRARSGETLLVTAAAGALGTAAIQIARILGLRTIGAASSEKKRAWIREVGAEDAIEYGGIKNVRPDLVLESVGGDCFRAAAKVLKRRGRIVIVGIASGEAPRIDATRLVMRSQSVAGLHLEAHLGDSSAAQTLLGWVDEGALDVRVGHVYSLGEIAEAHELISSRNSIGKIVLTT